MRGSDFCKLTSSLNFNRVLNLKISNIQVEYSTGISAQNILGNSSINSCTFHGAASNITKEATSPPSVCIEFTYLQLSALPSKNHLSIHNSISPSSLCSCNISTVTLHYLFSYGTCVAMNTSLFMLCRYQCLYYSHSVVLCYMEYSYYRCATIPFCAMVWYYM